MSRVKSYHLPQTALIPNSPHPLLHYPGLLSPSTSSSTCDAAEVYDLFTSHGWDTQWIYRYGPTQTSHYHSQAHECMAVLSGTATIRFGVADTAHGEQDPAASHERGGVELHAEAGDVFLLPAGVAHKTFATQPAESFKLLTPGDGHHIAADDKRKALAELQLSGFTMMGAYPNGSVWDSCSGGENADDVERVWAVPKPQQDPVLGTAGDGLRELWQS